MIFHFSARILCLCAIFVVPLLASAQPDCFTIDGNLTVTAPGGLGIEIGGPAQCDQYDSIEVLGTTLFGSGSIIDVTVIDGYAPSGSFEILTSVGAIADNGIVLDPSDTGTFMLTVNANSVVLTAMVSPTDPDGNGLVNGADFLIIQQDNSSVIPQWEDDYGGPPSSASAAVASVPEPSSIMLLLGMAALANLRCVRRM